MAATQNPMPVIARGAPRGPVQTSSGDALGQGADALDLAGPVSGMRQVSDAGQAYDPPMAYPATTGFSVDDLDRLRDELGSLTLSSIPGGV